MHLRMRESVGAQHRLPSLQLIHSGQRCNAVSVAFYFWFPTCEVSTDRKVLGGGRLEASSGKPLRGCSREVKLVETGVSLHSDV